MKSLLLICFLTNMAASRPSPQPVPIKREQLELFAEPGKMTESLGESKK